MENNPLHSVAQLWERGCQRAYLIGANDYVSPLTKLTSPRRDADRIAQILNEQHHYQVTKLTDGIISLQRIREMFAQIQQEVGSDDRVIFYFAGHGVPPDFEAKRPGYLLPETARRDSKESFLRMDEVYQSLEKLPCKHLLIILDCCFAGSFRWARMRQSRDFQLFPEDKIYLERFRSLFRRKSRQLLTSSGANQLAADILFASRDDQGQHSPFAHALIAGLQGMADQKTTKSPEGDGVITLTELHAYIQQEMLGFTSDQNSHYYPLENHDDGEFLFLNPNYATTDVVLPSVSEITINENPYFGLRSYGFNPTDHELFFGRSNALKELKAFVSTHNLTVVLGASGTGKSSLVKAGLMCELDIDDQWYVIPPIVPGEDPIADLLTAFQSFSDTQLDFIESADSLAELLQHWLNSQVEPKRILIVVDQLENLTKSSIASNQRSQFMNLLLNACQIHHVHCVVTLRTDFEGSFFAADNEPWQSSKTFECWANSRFMISNMTDQEIRETIVAPANLRAIYLETEVVDALVAECSQQLGALPLLSATLEELYEQCVSRLHQFPDADWTITWSDYEHVGGLAGAIRRRAERVVQEAKNISEHGLEILRVVMLRLVDFDGINFAKRRAPNEEFVHGDPEYTAKVQQVLRCLDQARLVIFKKEGIEPIHDSVIRGWSRLERWLEENSSRAETGQVLQLPQQRRLTLDARKWSDSNPENRHLYLWNHNPVLDSAANQQRQMPQTLNRMETEFVTASVQRRKVLKRRRLSTFVSAIVILATFSAVTFWLYLLSESRSEIAESRRLASAARFESATRLSLSHNLALAAMQTRDTVEARGSLLYLQRQYPALLGSHSMHLLDPSHDRVAKVAYSNDGRFLGSLGDRKFYLFDMNLDFPFNAPVYESDRCMAFAFDNDSSIKMVRDNQTLDSYDYGNQQINSFKLPFDLGGDGMQILVSPNGKWLAITSQFSKTVHVASLPNPQRWKSLATLPSNPNSGISFDASSSRIAVGCEDGVARVYALNGKLIGTFPKLEAEVFHTKFCQVAFHPNKLHLATVVDSGKLQFWDVKTGKELPYNWGWKADRGLHAFAFSPDGRYYAVTDFEKIMVFSYENHGRLATLKFHQKAPSTFAFSKTGQLASGGHDGRVAIWDAKTFDALAEPIEKAEQNFSDTAISRSGSTLVATNAVGIYAWTREPHGNWKLKHFSGKDDSYSNWDVAISPDESLVCSWFLGQLRVLDLETNATFEVDIDDDKGRVLATRFLHDANSQPSVVVIRESGDVQLWDYETGKLIVEQRVSQSIDRAEFVPMSDDFIYHFGNELWRGSFKTAGSESGFLISEPKKLGIRSTWSPTFSSNGKSMAWSTESGFQYAELDRIEAARSLSTPDDPAVLFEFNHDASLIALGHDSGDVTLWDAASGQRIGSLFPITGPRPNSRSFRTLAFSSEHPLLACVDNNSDLHVFNLRMDQLINRSKQIAGTNFSANEWIEYFGVAAPYGKTIDELPLGDGVEERATISTSSHAIWSVSLGVLACFLINLLIVPWRSISARRSRNMIFVLICLTATALVVMMSDLKLGNPTVLGLLTRTCLLLLLVGVVALMGRWLQGYLELGIPVRSWKQWLPKTAKQ